MAVNIPYYSMLSRKILNQKLEKLNSTDKTCQ